MKKALLLILFLVSLGFVSRVLACFEFECHDLAIISWFLGQLGWKLLDALL